MIFNINTFKSLILKELKKYNLLDLSFPILINISDIITMKVSISYLTTHWVVDTVHIHIVPKL